MANQKNDKSPWEGDAEFEHWWASAGIFPESFCSPGHPNYMLFLSYKEVAAKAWNAAKAFTADHVLDTIFRTRASSHKEK